MPVTIDCPLCRAKNQVPRVVPGKTAVCPTCGHAFLVSQLSSDGLPVRKGPPPLPPAAAGRRLSIGLIVTAVAAFVLLVAVITLSVVTLAKRQAGSQANGKAVRQGDGPAQPSPLGGEGDVVRPQDKLPPPLQPKREDRWQEESVDLVKKYFAAATWQERLPCVLNPDKVRPLRQARYGQEPLPRFLYLFSGSVHYLYTIPHVLGS
jgi:hypothetical protein